MGWSTLISTKQFDLGGFHRERHENRSGFQRDYDRLIFSAPFWRSRNKAQVFSLLGSIFTHSRPTYSLEVSYVGRSLGNDVVKVILERCPDLRSSYLPEISSTVSTACLIHDLRNLPFGYSGERAISILFSKGKDMALRKKQPNGEQLTPAQWKDLTYFKGDANTFRLPIYRSEGCRKGGSVLTYPTLASIVKCPSSSSLVGEKSKSEFFTTEESSFRWIAEELGMKKPHDSLLKYVHHPLVYLAEAADDICYQMMDTGDAHKPKTLTTQETQELLLPYFPDECKVYILDTFKIVGDTNEQIVYPCLPVIGLLIGECTQALLNDETRVLEGEFGGSLIKHTSEQPTVAYKRCAEVSFKKIYHPRDVLDIELAGFRIISTLLELMINAVCSSEKTYPQSLINRVPGQYNMKATALHERIQAVLDYISGTTDVFAFDLYRKINGNNLPAV